MTPRDAGHEDLFDEEARHVDAHPGRGQASHSAALPYWSATGRRPWSWHAGPAEGPTIRRKFVMPVRKTSVSDPRSARRRATRPGGRDVRSIVFGGPDRFF